MAAFNDTLNHKPHFLRVMKLSFMLQRSSSEENLLESTPLTVTLRSLCLSRALSCKLLLPNSRPHIQQSSLLIPAEVQTSGDIKVTRYHSAHTEPLSLQVIPLLLI